MSDDKKPEPPKSQPPQPAKKEAKPEPQPAGPPPPLDERKLKYAELLPHASTFDAAELTGMLTDGRAIVRGNAALALAAAHQAPFELTTLLRDSETAVALAAAESLARLGPLARGLVTPMAQATSSAKTEVTEAIVAALADLFGKADDELIAALDLPSDVANKSVIAAAKVAGKTGIAFLARATQQERSRIRINAVSGLGLLGRTDPDAAMACLTQIEASDPVPDVRTAAKHAMLAVVAREKIEAVDGLPKNIPDFEARKLTNGELAEYEGQIDIDQMMFALQDGRDHVRINAARCIAVTGGKAGRAATAMGLLMRDSAPSVRREVAKALGKLGPEAVPAAGDLIGALGDGDSDVWEAAVETLERLGAHASDALLKGLDAGGEQHGRRVAELVTKLPRAADLLVEAFGSPAVNVQVNAAAGLGMLGKDRIGAKGLAALHGARTGGDVRTRGAVRAALDLIETQGDTGLKPIAVAGFEDRFLAMADLDKAKGELDKVGVADLTAHLTDGRDVVRANAALALGALAGASAGSALALGVLLRDDSPRVRLAAAQALDKIGDAAVVETGDYLVGALRDGDDKVAEMVAGVLRARKSRMIGALVRGLETDDPRHGKRIVEVVNVLPDATEILCDAFESPAVNVQVNAARGLGMLGDKVGKGRKALEGSRTGGFEPTREAVRAALEMLDGPRKSGPDEIEIDGFETRVLEPSAFADPAKLRADLLVHYLIDGRPVVRANAATGLGAVGAPALGALSGIAVLMRDDDMRVRIAAANAIDKLGDDAVKEAAPFLVGALRGDAEVAKAVQKVLGARKSRVLSALLKGLETDDETQARRILELINALQDPAEILCDAFESPAENVQVNAAMGIGMLGEKRAGSAGKKKLEGARTGGFARTREAVFKALAALKNG